MSEFLPEHSAGEGLPQSDRLQILSPEEYELLWGFPRFTQSDRDLFFTLTAPERVAVEQCRSVRTKIHLLLHLGYFRARQRFFRFELPAVRDESPKPPPLRLHVIRRREQFRTSPTLLIGIPSDVEPVLSLHALSVDVLV